MAEGTEPNNGWLPRGGTARPARPALGLMIAWSQAEPERVGEITLLPISGTSLLGRGDLQETGGPERVSFQRLRPGRIERCGPLRSPAISRQHLLFQAGGAGVEVQGVGKLPLRVQGREVQRARLEAGMLLEIEKQLLLLCVERSSSALASHGVEPGFAFGDPDDFGLVGESERAWRLRDELSFYARRGGHVLIQGPDAELFGNARNYPNPGMRERPGLVGEAHGGTLFLDEIGELPQELQAHLLRLMDDGEYHRLGDEQPRRSDLRLLAATNRGESSLKHDLLARLKLRLLVPGLDERREDIPLLIRVLLRRIAAEDGGLRARFFEGTEARVAPELVAALLDHRYTTHVRELESLLYTAMAESTGHFVALTVGVERRLAIEPLREDASPPQAGPPPTAQEVEAALERHQGNVSRAWKELGLSSRDALNRLLKKYQIQPRRT
ncbi:MAG: sigma 54-interacting transcriptional regulator [Polyangiaceae bacterium]|nr:sigma 54-interacting transcriptional regulator [Polyangiaceae bacterium]